jgi:hypothetical protein
MFPVLIQMRITAPVAVCALMLTIPVTAQAPKAGVAQSLSDNATRVQSSAAPVAFDTLAGPLADTVHAGTTPYLIVGDIEVPAGHTVTVEAGVVFLFKNFTGLHVQGKLDARGTKERPIIFTSENDRARNPATSLYPNPYDWNGMYIHSDATGTMMSYCTVMYSVYGIVSETKFIRIDHVTFLQNGKSNLVIEGKAQPVMDAPYIYLLSTADVKAEGVPVKILHDPTAIRRDVVRYAGFTVFLWAAAGSIYYGAQWKKAQDDLGRLSTDDPALLRFHDEAEWYSLRDRRNKNEIFTGAGAFMAAIGLAGFCWTFTF